MLLLGPNIHVAKDVTMTQNGIAGCHWAISGHLIDVCLLHRIGALRAQGSQIHSVPWSTSSGSQEALVNLCLAHQCVELSTPPAMSARGSGT